MGVDELFYNVRVRFQTLDSQRVEDLGLRKKERKMRRGEFDKSEAGG